MSNKNKTIALASLIAAGAGVAAVAASNSHKQAKAKKIAEKQQAESGTPYRNTERGKYEKNSKGIYYTNGNYEAFAHPKKPEGVDEKSAYIVGSGLASLAAACFLVRDGQMPGDHIHILEAMDIAGGACDGIFDPSRGYVMRGGREMENHFECLWDLFRSIPSIETPGVSVLDEYYWLNKEDPNYSLCRATENRGEDAHTDGRFNLSQKGCMEIMKLFMTKDGDLSEPVSPLLIKNSCCQRAFLRGAFLCIGSMSDPQKSYHLEFVCTDEDKARQLQSVIQGFDIEAKIVLRKKYYVVYLKEGSGIVDLLNVCEAPIALMKLENLRIVKEMRNSVNRRVNCETANITKTVTAATRQIEDIIYIRDHYGLENLPEPTRPY